VKEQQGYIERQQHDAQQIEKYPSIMEYCRNP
jgi:hypothetical protein